MIDRPYRVLIVEDEPDINNLVADVLRAYGMEPVQALTGEEALRRLDEQPPDAIILDLMLPGLTGYAVCSQVKTSRRTSGIPVLILTALDRSADRRLAYETGADEYVTKPFSPEGLVARLRACIERSRKAAEPAGRMSMTFELASSAAGLKAVNALVTALYCRTALPDREIEALRSALLRLAEAASGWAASRDGTSPVRVAFDLDAARLRLAFEPSDAAAEAFVQANLESDAAVPAELMDAGAIDRQTVDGQAMVLEKALAPKGEP